MQKIDRLGWAAGVSFDSYGLKIGVRVNKPEALPTVLERLPPGWRPIDSPFVDHLVSFRLGGVGPRPNMRNFTLVYSGLAQVARTMNPEEALEALEQSLQLHVAGYNPDRVFVHAGVVGWQERAIVLPGHSFAGKSTLVAALLRAGASYYSDEYAVLDAEGMVHPYPRRLSLRQPDGSANRRCFAEDLGSQTGTEPLPPALVALTRYHPAGRWSARELSPGKAVLNLMNNAVTGKTAPERSLVALERLALTARNLTSLRGEAEETAAVLLEEAMRSPLAA